MTILVDGVKGVVLGGGGALLGLNPMNKKVFFFSAIFFTSHTGVKRKGIYPVFLVYTVGGVNSEGCKDTTVMNSVINCLLGIIGQKNEGIYRSVINGVKREVLEG